MIKYSYLLILTFLFAIITPIPCSFATETVHTLHLSAGYEKVTKVLEATSGQKLYFTFENSEKSPNSIAYTVTKLDGSRILAHGHLNAGACKEVIGNYVPGMYRVILECPTQDSTGTGSVIIRDQEIDSSRTLSP